MDATSYLCRSLTQNDQPCHTYSLFLTPSTVCGGSLSACLHSELIWNLPLFIPNGGRKPIRTRKSLNANMKDYNLLHASALLKNSIGRESNLIAPCWQRSNPLQQMNVFFLWKITSRPWRRSRSSGSHIMGMLARFIESGGKMFGFSLIWADFNIL